MRIVDGSKEYVIVDVSDKLGTITNLASLTPKYFVKKKLDGTTALADTDPNVVSGMKLSCLIDTTIAAFVPGIYQLFVKFTSAPEAPILGPIEFEIS